MLGDARHFSMCFRQVLARAVKKAKHVCVHVLYSLINAVSSSYHVKLCSASEVFHKKIKHIFHGTKNTVVCVNSSCVCTCFSLGKEQCKNIARDCSQEK